MYGARMMGTPAHQLLYGYYRGHRLVSGSTTVPQEAESEMLALSDLSGPRMLPGFDGYLTGYPVTSMECYALARTWACPRVVPTWYGVDAHDTPAIPVVRS